MQAETIFRYEDVADWSMADGTCTIGRNGELWFVCGAGINQSLGHVRMGKPVLVPLHMQEEFGPEVFGLKRVMSNWVVYNTAGDWLLQMQYTNDIEFLFKRFYPEKVDAIFKALEATVPHFTFVTPDLFLEPGQCTITKDGQLWTLNEKGQLATCFVHPGAIVRMPKALAPHYGEHILGLVSNGYDAFGTWEVWDKHEAVVLTFEASVLDLSTIFQSKAMEDRSVSLGLWNADKISEVTFIQWMEDNETDVHPLPAYVAKQLEGSSAELTDRQRKLRDAIEKHTQEHMTPIHVVKESVLHSREFQGVPDPAINYRFEDTDGFVPDEAKPGRCFIDRFGCFWFVPATKDDVCYPGVETAKPAKPVEFGYVKPGEAVQLRGGHVVYGVHQNIQIFAVCDTKGAQFLFGSNEPEKVVAALDRAAQHYATLGLLDPPYTMNPEAFQAIKDNLPRAKGRTYRDLAPDEQALLDGVEDANADEGCAVSNWHPNSPRTMTVSLDDKPKIAKMFGHVVSPKHDGKTFIEVFGFQDVGGVRPVPLSEERVRALNEAIDRVRNPMMSLTIDKNGDTHIERIPNDPFDEQLAKFATPYAFPMSPSPELTQDENDFMSELRTESQRQEIDRKFKALAATFHGWSMNKENIDFVRVLYAHLGAVINESSLHEPERFFNEETFRFPYPPAK